MLIENDIPSTTATDWIVHFLKREIVRKYVFGGCWKKTRYRAHEEVVLVVTV